MALILELAANGSLDLGTRNPKVVQLAVIEGVELTDGALVGCKLCYSLTDVHFLAFHLMRLK
jgi:hypothetical protein